MTLVALDPDVCPDCGTEPRTLTWAQPALLIHGGYGATSTTTIRYCPCGWHLVTAVRSDNPRSVT